MNAEDLTGLSEVEIGNKILEEKESKRIEKLLQNFSKNMRFGFHNKSLCAHSKAHPIEGGTLVNIDPHLFAENWGHLAELISVLLNREQEKRDETKRT